MRRDISGSQRRPRRLFSTEEDAEWNSASDKGSTINRARREISTCPGMFSIPARNLFAGGMAGRPFAGWEKRFALPVLLQAGAFPKPTHHSGLDQALEKSSDSSSGSTPIGDSGVGKAFRYSCSSADRRALDTSSSAVFQMLSCLTPIRTYDKFGQTFAQTFSWLVYLSNIL